MALSVIDLPKQCKAIKLISNEQLLANLFFNNFPFWETFNNHKNTN